MSLHLTEPDIRLIEAVGVYKYMTALDLAYLLYAPSSLTYVRKRASRLAGGADGVPDQYLLRFDPPHIGPGRSEKIFTLGVKGLELLASLQGRNAMDWWYRPYKIMGLSYLFLSHALFLTRFVVAANYWHRQQEVYALTECRLSYELSRNPALTSINQRGKTMSVIPDAFLCFERDTDSERFPVLFEADLGTESGKQFRQHIRNRLDYIQSPQYERLADTRSVRVCYLTTGQVPRYKEARRATMRRWAQEVLVERGLNQEEWLSVFLFAACDYSLLLHTPLFTDSIWHYPDSHAPVSLWHQHRDNQENTHA